MYKADECSSSRPRRSNLPCWNILLQVFLQAFIFFPGGLQYGPSVYFCNWALERNLILIGFVLRKSVCVLSGKILYVTRVSFACIHDQQYFAILLLLLFYTQNLRNLPYRARNYLTIINIPHALVLSIHSESVFHQLR